VRRIAIVLLAATLLLCDDTPAPPAIAPDGVWNSVSQVPPSLPAGAIARGARIAVTGVRFSPKPTVTLNGAPLAILSATPRRIEAVIPESAEPGPARLIVTTAAGASEPYALDVAASGFGFNPSIQGDATPGGSLTLEGSGAGAADLDLFIGGKRASVLAVKLKEPGLYTVTAQAPRDAPSGCFVPVSGRSRTTGRPTNFTAARIHAPNEPCHDQVDWFRDTVEHATSAGVVALARITLLLGEKDEYVFDYGLASFARQESGNRPFPPFPPFGTCTGFTERVNLRQTMARRGVAAEWPEVAKPAPGNRVLKPGPLDLAHGGRAIVLARAGVIGGRAPLEHTPPTPLFLTPGRIRISSKGTAEVGAFESEITATAPISWRNRRDLAEVARASGATVEWKAARKDDAVLIVAVSAEERNGDSAMCLCMAQAAAGRFQIPAQALANLPVSDPAEPDLSYMLLLEVPASPPTPVTARGIDTAFAAFVSASVRETSFR